MTRARDNAFYGDINGNELILDADGDTSITSDTDDQIDIKVGGSDKVVIDSSGNVTISANLTVNGTTTTINSTTLSVDDKNIELGSVSSPDDTTADGGGITLKGATDHTFNWVNSTDAWTSSEHLNLASGKEFKINNTSLKDVSETLTNKSGNISMFTNDSNFITSTVAGDFTVDTSTLKVDSTNNRVGIGTTSPAQALHVVAADARVRTEESSGNTTFEMTNTSGGHFLDSSGTNDLTINKIGSANLILKTNNTEQMRIDSSGNLKFNSGYGSAATAYGVRAWVNFNGSGTPAARASGGVSSIGDRGTGMFTVNLSVTTPDVNGAVVATSSNNDTASSSEDTNVIAVQNSTSALFINLEDSSGGAQRDDAYINVVYMR